MPIRCGKGRARYRFRQTKHGQQRLAWCGNRVVETKEFPRRKGRR